VPSFSQSIQKSTLKIIEVTYNNPAKMNESWLLTYIQVDNQIYTGAFFDDYGDIYKFRYDKELSKYLFNELSEKWKYSKNRNKNKSFYQMNTGIKNIDSFFFWRCFEVAAEYIITSSDLNKNDFFPFFYNQNKKVLGFAKIDFSKVKKLERLPCEFLKEIVENSKCIENLGKYESFQDYIKCFDDPSPQLFEE
jgi:hypothetical protein